MKGLKLNLGSRNNLLKGYINIDFSGDFDSSNFKKMDILSIDDYFLAGTVSEIKAVHFMEHLTHQQVTVLMYKLWCLLIPAGVLEIITPDFYNLISYYKDKHKNGDFSDVDILHIKVFDTEEETFHKTVWYEEIGKYYLEREGFFSVKEVSHPSFIEIKFKAVKL